MLRNYMRVAELRGPANIVCTKRKVPTIKSTQVLIKMRFVGICGSDIPRFLNGTEPYGFSILGHEGAGEVVEVGDDVTNWLVGDRVALNPVIPCKQCPLCKAGYYSLCENFIRAGTRVDGFLRDFVPIEGENLIKLADEISLQEAALLEPMVNSLHGLERANLKGGEDVAILGCGSIGLLGIGWASVLGADRIFGVDISEFKLNLAKKLGATDVVNPYKRDVDKYIKSKTGGRGVDVTLEAAGAQETITNSFSIARKLGKISLVGLPKGSLTITPDQYYQVVRKKLHIFGSYDTDYGNYPSDNWDMALNFLKRNRISPEPIITHSFNIEDIDEAFQFLSSQEQQSNVVKVVVTF